jgi:DNA-binding MarR family transcriptional regulator
MPKQHYVQKNFRSQDSIGYLLKTAFRAMSEFIHGKFATQGCSFQQWVVLIHLRDGVAVTVADLSREMRHDSGAMTRVIDQLEARGWIERQRNREDRRVVELSLTADGNAVAESLVPLVVNTLNAALEDFSREEVQQLQGMLRRLAAKLHEMDSAPESASSAATSTTKQTS